MAEKPVAEKQQSVLKRLVKQRNGRVSKTQIILSKNRRFPAKMGGLESLQ